MAVVVKVERERHILAFRWEKVRHLGKSAVAKLTKKAAELADAGQAIAVESDSRFLDFGELSRVVQPA